MYDLTDVYNELDCIADQLSILSMVVTDDYAENCGRISGNVLQDAIYSVVQHIERVRDDVEKIDHRA